MIKTAKLVFLILDELWSRVKRIIFIEPTRNMIWTWFPFIRTWLISTYVKKCISTWPKLYEILPDYTRWSSLTLIAPKINIAGNKILIKTSQIWLAPEFHNFHFFLNKARCIYMRIFWRYFKIKSFFVKKKIFFFESSHSTIFFLFVGCMSV